MTKSLSSAEVRRLRLRGQHLSRRSAGTGAGHVAQVVHDLCGLQAQELPAAALSIAARRHGLVATDVEHARIVDRSIVRIWGQRGTLHLLAADDLAWLLPLFGPAFIAGDKRRRAELGLTDDACEKGSQLIRDLLAKRGPQTRAEIVAQLAPQGLRLEGQAAPHFLAYCALSGLICFGPEQQGEPTYVLIEQWLPHWQPAQLSPAEAAGAELAQRYLRAYGPAKPEEFASWSGLSLKDTRPAWKRIGDRLIEVQVDGQPAWMLATQAQWLDELPMQAAPVRLLPRYDTYLLGYQNRDLVVAPQFAKRVNAGGGIIHPTVIADGVVLGIWKTRKRRSGRSRHSRGNGNPDASDTLAARARIRRRDQDDDRAVDDGLMIVIEPFEPFTPEVLAGVEREIEELARFLETPVELQVL